MNARRSCAVAFMLLGELVRASGFAADLPAPTPMHAAPFGIVTVYRPAQAEPASVALLVSGAGGSALGVAAMTRALAATGALVIGIDGRAVLTALARSKAACQPLAVDFELLSHQIPVSYTHLDVYKRQLEAARRRRRSTDAQAARD